MGLYPPGMIEEDMAKSIYQTEGGVINSWPAWADNLLQLFLLAFYVAFPIVLHLILRARVDAYMESGAHLLVFFGGYTMCSPAAWILGILDYTVGEW